MAQRGLQIVVRIGAAKTGPKGLRGSALDMARRFEQLADDMQEDILKTAAGAAAIVVVGSARENVHVVTGNLKRSLHWEVKDSSRSHAIASVGTNVEYARREEFGFVGEDSLGRAYSFRGHPYLRPALRNNRTLVRRVIADVIRDALRGS